MASKDSTISAKQARELLSYSPDTGTMRWVLGRSRSGSVGEVAGTLTGDGYRVIRIDGALFYAHRIAWLLAYGKWPDGRVDHVNGVRDDNRLVNLSVTTAQRPTHMKGVYLDKRARSNPWMARITVNGARRNLGCFPTPELAHAAYLEARREHHAEPSKAKDPYSAILEALRTFPDERCNPADER